MIKAVPSMVEGVGIHWQFVILVPHENLFIVLLYTTESDSLKYISVILSFFFISVFIIFTPFSFKVVGIISSIIISFRNYNCKYAKALLYKYWDTKTAFDYSEGCNSFCELVIFTWRHISLSFKRGNKMRDGRISKIRSNFLIINTLLYQHLCRFTFLFGDITADCFTDF